MAKNEWDDEELPVEDPTLVEDKSGQLIIQDPNVSKKFAQVDRKEQELVEEKIKKEAEESQATESAPEKKSKKGLIAGAVVVAVLAGAGLTFLGGDEPTEQADVQNVQSEENATPVEGKQEVAESTSFEMPAQETKAETPAVAEVEVPAPVVEQVASEQKEVTTVEQPAVETPKAETVEIQKVEEPVKQEVAETPAFEMPVQEAKAETPAVAEVEVPAPVVEQVAPEQKEVTTVEQPAVETPKVETTEVQKVEASAVEMPNGESPRAGESALIESAPAPVVEQVASKQKEVTTAEQPAVEAPKSEVGDVVEQVAHPDLVKQVDEVSNKLLVLAEGTQQGFLLFQDNIQKLGAWNGKQDGIIQALHEGHVDVLKRLDALEKKVSSLEEEKAGLIKKIDELDQWKVDKRHKPTAISSKSTVAPAQVQAQKVAKKESNYVVFDDEKKTAKVESQHVAKRAKVKTAVDSTKVEQVEGNQTQSASAPVEKESAQLRSVFNGLAWVTVNGHSKTYMIGDTLMGSKIGAIDNTGIYDTLGNKMLDLR